MERGGGTEVVWHRDAVAEFGRLPEQAKDAFSYVLNRVRTGEVTPSMEKGVSAHRRPKGYVKRFSFADDPLHHIRNSPVRDASNSAHFVLEGSRLFVLTVGTNRRKIPGEIRKTLHRRVSQAIEVAEATGAAAQDPAKRYLGEPPRLPTNQEIRNRYLPRLSQPDQPHEKLKIPPAPGWGYSRSKTARPPRRGETKASRHGNRPRG